MNIPDIKTAVGVHVNKLRTYDDTHVSNLVKKIIKKWKDQVSADKKRKTKPSSIKDESNTVEPTTAAATPTTTTTTTTMTTANTTNTNAKAIKSESEIASAILTKKGPRTALTDGLKIETYTDTTRNRSISALYTAVAIMTSLPSDSILKTCVDIESAIFSQNKDQINDSYRNKLRSLILNIKNKNNQQLRDNILDGTILPSKLINMTSQELAPESLKKELESLHQKNLFDAQGAVEKRAVTDRFVCGKCKKREVSYYQMQTRSADEPLTTFCTCEKCGNHNKIKGVLPKCSYLPSWDLSTTDIIDIYEGTNNDKDKTIQSIINKYNNSRLFHYQDMKPLWKIAFLKESNTLFFLMDHTFFDGTAAKNFHYIFANSLHESSTINSLIVDTKKFKEYPDPTILLGFNNETKPSISDLSITTLPPFDQSLMNTPLPIHNNTFYNISSKDSLKLIEIARSNNTKLTALLYAIAAKSIISLSSIKLENTTFKTMIPINTRPKVLKINPNIDTNLIQFGQFFGKYFHLDDPIKILNDSIKEISNYFQSKLNLNVSHAMDDFEVFEFKALKNPLLIDESLQQLYDRNSKPKTTLVMSNLGVLNSKDINKIYFDQPMVDACFGLHFISSSEAGICINFTSHRAVKREDYLTYVSNVKNHIDSILY
ncbi:RNA polymerase II elongation factor [Pichia californica]|uniref:RNA polymerase II elongation factor n=1 Tax=Pichia californica TaxID=460514 RepID=A0A9P6WMN1_9ASCO|nr:RNA polymerase II elongation factor [[Candida] californica]